MKVSYILHLIFAAIIAFCVAYFLSPVLGFLAAILLGALKELWNTSERLYEPKQSWLNMACMFTGALVMSLAVAFVNYQDPELIPNLVSQIPYLGS